MIHKQIFDSVLSELEGEKAGYFADVANKLDEDPRVQDTANLVFLVLKDTAPFIPIYLPSKVFIDELLQFIQTHHRELSRLIFSREFIEDPSLLRKISTKFVGRVLEVILEQYEDHGYGETQQSEHLISWPYDNVDFPYVDDDD